MCRSRELYAFANGERIYPGTDDDASRDSCLDLAFRKLAPRRTAPLGLVESDDGCRTRDRGQRTAGYNNAGGVIVPHVACCESETEQTEPNDIGDRAGVTLG